MFSKHFIHLLAMLFVLLLTFSALAEDLDLPKIYPKNDQGEAIINDVQFAPAYEVDDLNRVFYEIFVGSFSDSDGDGVGDLRGIINRLDYLNDGNPQSGLSLGVEGLWLTPIFASPSYHKYDVADYYTVDPTFGTMDDLHELIELCHSRGMKVILDLPINHTSRQNVWFKRFSNAKLMNNDQNAYYDFYSCIENSAAVPAGCHFTPLSSTRFAYESNFSSDMPELNFDNELVRQAVVDVARFYLEQGVDGFRFDAAKYIYFEDHDRNVDFWHWYIDELKAIEPDVYTVAEVWDGEGIIDRYVKATNCFSFPCAQAEGLIANTAKAGDVNKWTAYVQRTIERIHDINEDAMPILFVSNHDMDRAAGYLTVANGYMQMAANLYLLSPGSPFIYYGEEIGMRGSRGGANTDANRRLAMLWGDGDTVHDPIGATYEQKKQTPYHVSALLGSGSSLYNYYKRLLMIRKANPEIARGQYTALTLENTKLGGFVSEWEGSKVAVLHNTTTRDMKLDLKDIPALTFASQLTFIGMGEALLNGSVLSIEGQTSVVLR